MTNQLLRVPAFCPVCQNMMKGKSTQSFYDWGCCAMCEIFFVEGHEQRWKDGWRPSKTEIEAMDASLSGAS